MVPALQAAGGERCPRAHPESLLGSGKKLFLRRAGNYCWRGLERRLRRRFEGTLPLQVIMLIDARPDFGSRFAFAGRALRRGQGRALAFEVLGHRRWRLIRLRRLGLLGACEQRAKEQGEEKGSHDIWQV